MVAIMRCLLALVGLVVAAMIAQGYQGSAPLAHQEDAFGFACRMLLFPGALGLMIASILAANMSTVAAQTMAVSALWVRNVYSYLKPGLTEHDAITAQEREFPLED